MNLVQLIPNTVTAQTMRMMARAIRYTPNPVLSKFKPVINKRGDRLDPDVALSLSILNKAQGNDFTTMLPVDGRELIDREASYTAISKHHKWVQTEDGDINGTPIRTYYGKSALRKNKVLIYLHGGGWTLGSIESHDVTCRYIAGETGIKVVSVDYALAPESPYPYALNEVDKIIDHFIKDNEVSVAGDSAGGNLALAVTTHRINSGKELPAGIVAVVPVTNLHEFNTGSYDEFKTGFFLTKAQMEWYKKQYITEGVDTTNPLVSPIYTPNEVLEQFPPTLIVTAGFDPLRDEGEAFYQKLKGVSDKHFWVNAINQCHPFINSPLIWRDAGRYLMYVCQWIGDTHNLYGHSNL